MYKQPYFYLKQDMTLCITTPRKEYHRGMEWQHVKKSVSLGNTSKWTGAWSGVFISIKTNRVYIGLGIYAVMTNCMWKRAIMYTCSLSIQYHLKWNDWNPNGHSTSVSVKSILKVDIHIVKSFGLVHCNMLSVRYFLGGGGYQYTVNQ
jgi:hypothetical protein